ncbi:pirin family protein [Nonlabens xiamenensis]|uniref:pirin family protein n=1 Tax=Nonlabens xiamenensis TaxID=2341043 RepID=UPI000F6157E7|nr:pirin family protein [Nonlabens xiamenensis]
MPLVLQTELLGFPWPTRDPFLFCVHHLDHYPSGDSNMQPPEETRQGRILGQDFSPQHDFRMYHGKSFPGFPYHPHRGFETITINRQGIVDHSDSLGGAGRFGSGDVQWMTAGKGILHSEMFPLVHEDRENTLEIFQIWLNLPASAKMVDPHFKMLWKNDIPSLEQKDQNGHSSIIQLVAGQFGDHHSPDPTPDSWAADPKNGVMVLVVEMEPQAELLLPKVDLPEVHRTLYFYKGQELIIDDKSLKSGLSISVEPSQDLIIKNGAEASEILVLQGKPINEPVAQHGPFVMNTQQEIQEAFSDYQRTQFGGWPWPEQEQVHDRKSPRFALHSDGRREVPKSNDHHDN